MKGLILKDLYTIGKNKISLVSMLFIYGIIFVPQNEGMSFISVCTILCGMMMVTTIAFDESAGWDKYALTMPVTRKNIVAAKFIVLFLFSLFGSLAGVVISSLFYLIKGQNILIEAVAVSGVSLCLALLFGGIMIPLTYQLGVEKARLLTILIYVVPIVIITGAAALIKVSVKESNYFSNLFAKETSVLFLICLLPVITAIVLYMFYKISLRIYLKKEF